MHHQLNFNWWCIKYNIHVYIIQININSSMHISYWTLFRNSFIIINVENNKAPWSSG